MDRSEAQVNPRSFGGWWLLAARYATSVSGVVQLSFGARSVASFRAVCCDVHVNSVYTVRTCICMHSDQSAFPFGRDINLATRALSQSILTTCPIVTNNPIAAVTM